MLGQSGRERLHVLEIARQVQSCMEVMLMLSDPNIVGLSAKGYDTGVLL